MAVFSKQAIEKAGFSGIGFAQNSDRYFDPFFADITLRQNEVVNASRNSFEKRLYSLSVSCRNRYQLIESKFVKINRRLLNISSFGFVDGDNHRLSGLTQHLTND